jgi:hypothetical protein
MTIKVCSNVGCSAYAHVVYTVAMRCTICRCDLKVAHRGSEGAKMQPGRAHAAVAPRRSLRVGGTRVAK